MKRISWNQYFMAQSKLVALRSTCTRLMVGATIVRENRIIASGYNGSVADSTHCIDEGCHMVEGHCVRTVHAEANAILQCARFGVPTENTTLYVTHFPCLQCCKIIIQAGIKSIYYENDYRNNELAVRLFAEANINIKKVELNYVDIDSEYTEKQEVVNELLQLLKESNVDDALAADLEKRTNKLFSIESLD